MSTPGDEREASREILRLIRANDRRGFDTAYRRYTRGLTAIARNRLIEKEKAPGLVHDVWEKCLEKLLVEPADDTKLAPYLRTFVCNLAGNYNRRTKLRNRVVVTNPDERSHIGDLIPRDETCEVASAVQRLEQIDRAIDKQPMRDQDVLRSEYFEGQSDEQIRQRHGLTQAQLTRVRSRARLRLIEGLDEASKDGRSGDDGVDD